MTVRLRDADLYVAVVEPPQVKLRDADLYVAVQVIGPATSRQFNALVVKQDSRPALARKFNALLIQSNPYPDWSIPGKQNFRAKMNAQYGLSFDSTMLSIGTPEVFASAEFNSRVKVSALTPSGYSGSKWLRFDRFEIADAFIGKSLGAYRVDGTSVHGILPKINTDFGLALTVDDVENGPYDKNQGYLKLVAKAGSFYFIPGSSVELGVVPLAFATTDLNGFRSAGSSV